jgi:pSer/pThr/pTyr-binding forkhead associated (FHA) protein
MPGGPAVLRFSRGLPPTKQYGERLRLLVRQGQDQGTCYSLLGDLVFVGREDCQIVLNDTNISRKHAEISWKGDHYVIRDLGSANGIVFNGSKVPESKLNPGDIVLMGLTVVEVYPPGQTRKNEKPLLAAPIKRLSAVPALEAAPDPKAAQVKLTAKEEKELKRKVERKRMLLFVAVFFGLGFAYFNDDNATIRGHAKIQQAEDEETPRDKKTGLPIDNSAAKIKSITEAIQKRKLDLVKLQEQKSQLEEKQKTSKNLSSQALIEEANGGGGDKAQHKDADIFFRTGVRELQNKNYRRACTALNTALTVDPSHELAKIYLKSASMELLSELWSNQVAGLRAKASLRFSDSRMNFENIVRYLDNDAGSNTCSSESETGKELKELYEDAKKELTDLELLEKKGK